MAPEETSTISRPPASREASWLQIEEKKEGSGRPSVSVSTPDPILITILRTFLRWRLRGKVRTCREVVEERPELCFLAIL